MAISRLERKLTAILPQLLTADGTSNGVVKVANSCLFRHRQDIIINAASIDPIEGEIKEVFDEVTVLVGPRSFSLKDRIDLSAYTTALGATIEAPRQAIKAIGEQEINLSIFERAPVSATRIIPVNKGGNLNDTDNPIFVERNEFGSAAAAALVQLTYANLQGENIDNFMVNDNGEILFNNAGQLLQES